MSGRRPVTLITGASAGLGAALAREFSRHGHDLVLVARREASLAAAADAIMAAGRRRPDILAADLSQANAAETIDDAMSALGVEPQYVVNNAGFGLAGGAATLSRAEQINMIDLNVRTLTDFSLRWTGALARHRGGILNIASIASFLPGPQMAVYHATKAYVLSFSEALAHELAGSHVRVCALCPGPVLTGFQARAGIDIDNFPRALVLSREQVAREGYAALMAGKPVVIPGIANRLLCFLPRLLPRALVVRLMGRSSNERTRISNRDD